MVHENIWVKVKEAKFDPEVGIAISKLAEGENASVHVAIVNPGVKLKDHYHKFRDEIYVILKGKGEIRLNDRYIEVVEGDVVLIPKGTIHSIRNIGDEVLIFLFMSSPPFDPEHDRYIVD